MEYDDDGRQGLQEDDLLDDAEVDTLIRDTIYQTIGECLFDHAQMAAWTDEIVRGCLTRLNNLKKPFKYVVSCNLAQKVRDPQAVPPWLEDGPRRCVWAESFSLKMWCSSGWSWNPLCLHSPVE